MSQELIEYYRATTKELEARVAELEERLAAARSGADQWKGRAAFWRAAAEQRGREKPVRTIIEANGETLEESYV